MRMHMCAAACGSGLASRAPKIAGSSMAAASNRTTSARLSARPMSMGHWSVAPAWTSGALRISSEGLCYTDHLRLQSRAPQIMLYYLLVSVYVLVCLLLIVVILLQQGKGGDI